MQSYMQFRSGSFSWGPSPYHVTSVEVPPSMPPPVPPPVPLPVPVLVLVPVLMPVAPVGRGSSRMTPTRGMLAGLSDEGSPFAAGRRTCSRHQPSSVVISRHQPSSAVISRHQPSSAVISRHQ